MKNQHVAAIKCLAEASRATTTGLTVGSRTLSFAPTLPPSSFLSRSLKITPDSPSASALLILQALLPFLLFAGSESVEVEIEGGTNTSYSLSYEYVDQLLLPALEERFGLRVERKLRRRGWGYGPRGGVWVKITPLAKGVSLVPLPVERELSDARNFEVESVDVSLVVPIRLQEPLQTALASDLSSAFPTADVRFKVVDDSGHPTNIYLLLVAKSPTGLRWGRDILHEQSKKKTLSPDTIAAFLSREAIKQLSQEVEGRGEVDAYLQDQLVCFQALAAGRTSVVQHDGETGVDEAGSGLETLQIGGGAVDTRGPFGHGSMHTKTVRWIAAQLLPGARFLESGDVLEGAGVKFGEESASRTSADISE